MLTTRKQLELTAYMLYIYAIIGHNDDITSALFCSEYGPAQNVVPDGSIQNVGPKKRRRRDPSNSYIENSREIGPGTMAVKAPKRNALGIGKNVASTELSSYREYHSEGNKPVKSRSNSPGRMQKSNISNNATAAEYGPHPNIPSKDVSLPSSEIKDLEKHKTAAPQAVNFARTKTNDKYPFPAYLDKDAPVQLDLPLKKSSNVVKQDFSNKMRHKEIYGASQFSGLGTANNVYSAQTTVRLRGTGLVSMVCFIVYLSRPKQRTLDVLIVCTISCTTFSALISEQAYRRFWYQSQGYQTRASYS